MSTVSNTVQRNKERRGLCECSWNVPRSNDGQPLWSLLHVLPGQHIKSKAIFHITAQNNHFHVATDSNYIFWFAPIHSGKKKRNHTPTHAFSSPKSWYFYSRNNIITRTLNHLQGLHSDDLLYTCTAVAEYQMWAISNGAACHKVWYECAAQWNTQIDHILL